MLHLTTWSGRAGSTLEIDSGYKNKNIGFHPKSLRQFLRILYVVDDSIYIMIHVEGTSRALRKDAFGDLGWLSSQLIILIKSSFLPNKLTNIAKKTSIE